MAYLEVATPDGTRRVALTDDRLTLGRLPQCDVALPYVQVSRRHAELRLLGGEWWVADTGSTNGLHLGERRVREHRLTPGDELLLAPGVSVRFVADEAARPAVPDAGQQRRTGSPLVSFGPAPFGQGRQVVQGAADRARLPWPWNGPIAAAIRSDAGPTIPLGEAESAPGDRRDPYRRTMPARRSPIASVVLHVCQTCGGRTAPDIAACQACGHAITAPCATCGSALLPILERCPRCQAPNPSAIRHGTR